MEFKVQKTEEEWKEILTPEQYRVLREKGTERPFTGRLLSNKEKGIYSCAACGNKLFSSETKFDSGTGWPSFFDVIGGSVIIEEEKFPRFGIEVRCAWCNGHLGHVFNDGPEPTGLRYCIDSVALNFEKS